MKPQDIVFFLVLAILIYKRSSRLCTIAGLLCLIVAIPLFAKWVFFTAERLTWYAAALFLLAILLQFLPKKELKK